MGDFQIITYDVEHGNCHILITPSGNVVMIDAGSHSQFSPAEHIKENWNVEKLKWLTITHHDSDHITGLPDIDEHLTVSYLHQPDLTEYQIRELYNQEVSEELEYFFEFRKRFIHPAPPMSNGEYYDWGGVQFATFHNELDDFESPQVNNLSVVTFAQYQGWTFLFPGDLESVGWKKLLEKEEFCNWLDKVDVMVASHHGREAGYCEEVFDYCDPLLIIVSDKSISETSVTDKYRNKVKGQGLYVRKPSGEKERRFVLTTRQDGAIYTKITDEGKYVITIQN